MLAAGGTGISGGRSFGKWSVHSVASGRADPRPPRPAPALPTAEGQPLPARTVSTASEPFGRGRSSWAWGFVRYIHAPQSSGRNTTTCREWYGSTSGPGEVVSIVKAGPAVPFPSLQSPAIARNGAPLSVNRCFAFGYFLPVNSKNAEAGIKHRLLSAKRRPSDLKLNTGPPRPEGGKLKFICTSSTTLPAARITGPLSLILMSSAIGRSRSDCSVGIPSSADCIMAQY